jgi:hypothetical protein
MPLYIYEHPDGRQRVEVIQKMTDEHKYVFEGVEWHRVFEVPQAAVDSISTIDPFSKQQFMDRTAKLRGVTQGDLWDLSGELSKQRAKKLGKDPVKEKAEKAYEHRTGKPHPHSDIVSKHVIT